MTTTNEWSTTVERASRPVLAKTKAAAISSIGMDANTLRACQSVSHACARADSAETVSSASARASSIQRE